MLLLFAAWVLVAAAALVTHLSLFLRVARSENLDLRLRLLALVPPMTPVLAFLDGARLGPVLWVLLVLVYVVLRLVEP